jgi:hypothetical protein
MLSRLKSTHAFKQEFFFQTRVDCTDFQTYSCFFQPWGFYLHLGLEQLKDRTI